MKKISVIVPIYNQEKYIERCVSSLLNQTYKKIEIILVNDGSTDNSATICDGLAEKYKNIKVVHKKNGGLSSARNAGLEVVDSDYVAYLDSDDWVAKDTYEYALALLDKYNADIVKYDYSYTYAEDEQINSPKEAINVLNGKEILQNYMYDTTRNGSYGVCWYLFPTHLLKGELFREGKINEDIDFMYKILAKCKTIAISNQIKYYYYQQSSSLSTGGLKKKDFDLYEAAEELYKLAQNETFGTIAFLAKVKVARTPLSLLSKIALYGIADSSINKEKQIDYLVKELRQGLFVLLRAPLAPSRKVLALLFSLNYKVTEKLIQIVKRNN